MPRSKPPKPQATSRDEPDDDALSPAEIRRLKSARTKARKDLKALDASLLAVARQTLEAMPSADTPAEAIRSGP